MTASKLRIATRGGIELVEFAAESTRSWISTSRGGEGDCIWDMSELDAKTREEILRFGNLVYIAGEDGEEDWFGVIDLDPSTQDFRYGSVTVKAYSGERLLKFVDTPMVKATGTAGIIFKQIIDAYNQDTETPIHYGEIWEGGNSREETLGGQCFTEALRVASRANNEWDITMKVVDGKWKIYANWYQPRATVTNRELYQRHNSNIESMDPMLSKNGPIINTITGVSDASTSGVRIVKIKQNDASRALYGPRRKTIAYTGITDEVTLLASMEADLARYAFPVDQIVLNVLNIGGIKPYIRRGNILSVSLQHESFRNGGKGFEGSVKIFSKEVDDKVDKVKIGTEVVESH